MWRQTLYPYLLPQIADLLRALSAQDAARVTEIRFRVSRPVELAMDGGGRQTRLLLDAKDMEDLLGALCAHSRYAYEAQMASGYIPLPGGHRAGVCGRAVSENGRFVRMSAITSVCLRIARPVPGASNPIRRHLIAPEGRALRVLLLGPPGCGKTTVLRDAALYLSDEKGLHVAVADEREELFPSLPEGGQGKRLDVLAGADKAGAIMLLLRAMSPQVIVTDEVGRAEDAQALMEAARCGVGVLASAHADGLRGLMERPMLRALFEARAFERYIHLGPRASCLGAYDGDGKMLCGEEEFHGQLGCGADGDDRRERARVCGCGR